jgi:hypothetical protein
MEDLGLFIRIGDVRRLRHRYGRAGRGGTTNKQTDKETDSAQKIIIR